MKTGNKKSQKKEKPSSEDTRPAQNQDKPHYAKESTGGRSVDDSEEKYRTLFENMAPGVFYQRKDGSLYDVNPSALNMFGLTHEQFTGKDSYDPQWKVVSETGTPLLPEEHPSMIALQTGRPVRDMVVGIFNPQRNDFTWVKTNATPQFRQGEVAPCQVFVTMDDITELRRANASVAESEEKFRELFTRMPAAVAIYEAVGDGEDFIFRDFNAAAEAIEGIKKSDLVGKRVSEVFPGVTEFGLFDVFRRVLKSGNAEYYPAAVYRDKRDPGSWRENWVYKLTNGEIIAIYHDITERKRAEEEIKKAYALVNETQAISRVGGWEYDLATKRISWTDEVYRIHGVGKEFDPNDVTRNIGFYAPEDREVVQEAFRRAVEQGEPYDLEMELLPADGGRIWVRTIGRPVQAGGQVIRISGNIIDITDRKTAETALRESKERFSNAFEYAAIGMALISPEGRWLKVNQSICEIVGYSEDELQGMTFQDITHPDDLETDLEYVRQMIAGEIRTYHMEKRYFHKQGHLVWVLLSVSLVRDNQGKPRYFISQIENITGRKLVEERLRFINTILYTQTEASIDGILMVDESGKIISCNKQFIEIWGIPPDVASSGSDEQAIASVLDKLVDPGRFLSRVQYLYSHRQEKSRDEITLRDGRILDRYTAPMIGTAGEYYGRFWSFRDITERRLAEEALRESEERLRQIAENIPVVYYVHDRASNNFIYVSPAYEKIWGRPCQELYENPYSFLEAIDPDDMPSVQEAIRMELEEGKYFDREYRIIQPDGEIRWVNSRNFPVLDKQGTIYRVIGVAEDITGRKIAEIEQERLQGNLESLWNLAKMQNEDISHIANYVLEQIKNISQSEYAFYGYINDDETEMTIFSWSADAMKECRMQVRPILYPIKNAGIWGDAVRKRKTILINDYLKDFDGKRGLPKGHVSLTRLVSIPVFIGEKIVAVGAVANKQTAYTAEDIRQLETFLSNAQLITERNQAEQSLVESEVKFRTMVEASPDMIWEIDTQGNFTYISPQSRVQIGYEPGELIGQSVFSLIRPEGVSTIRTAFREHVQDHSSFSILEVPAHDKEGNHITIEIRSVPVLGSEGQLMGFQGMARDITSLKAAQEALRYSEEKYRDLAELMPQTIFETDLQGRLTYANRFAFNLFGYDSSDLEKGLDISQMVIPDDVNRAKQNLAGIAQGNKKSGNEYRFLLKNGGTFTGITYLSVIETNGKPVGFRGIIADISERKHNEDVLRLSHTLLERANQLVELPALLQEYVQIIKDYTGCGAVGIRLLDSQGNIQYQAYTGFSEAFYSTESPLSIKSDECMCTYVIRGTTDPTQPFFTPAGSFYMNGTTKFLATVSDEARGRTRNACNLAGYESVALIPIRQGDRITGLIHLADRRENLVPLATVQVIEEIADPLGSSIQRVSAERQVRESLDEKEVLLREIHHRVKNNLARVISLIGLQKAQLSDQEEITRFTDLEARIRSMSLVHESLYHSHSLSRINAQTYVQDLVQHLIQSYGPRADISWDIRMGDIVLPIDTAVHCGLIITEIVTNSIKYAFPESGPCNNEEGGYKITISMKETDGFITLNASDNGRGIPEGTILSGPGSLGLTLIRILVKNQLHGDLEMDTTRGTSFVIQFVLEPDTKGELYAG